MGGVGVVGMIIVMSLVIGAGYGVYVYWDITSSQKKLNKKYPDLKRILLKYTSVSVIFASLSFAFFVITFSTFFFEVKQTISHENRIFTFFLSVAFYAFYYDTFFDNLGISEQLCQDYGVGLVKGNSVMAGRICFNLTDHNQKHRGYTGFDHTKTKKVLWYVPQGTKVSDMLYNYDRKNGNDYCILVPTPLEALYMCSIGFTYTLGMLTQSLTVEQLELMKAFKRVIIISPTATTTALRLTTICFVKCIETGVMGKSYEEIKNLF